MKLFYSLNSPFARIARIAAIESGLAPQIEHIEVVNRTPDSPLLAYSPVCRVPTLVDGDIVLGEARNICAYFDEKTGREQFEALNTDWETKAQDSMFFGFLDSVGVWVRENRRPGGEKSQFILDVERNRAQRCLTQFDTLSLDAAQRTRWDFPAIGLACAIGIMNFNDLMPDWVDTYPSMKRWYDHQNQRPSMQQTAPQVH